MGFDIIFCLIGFALLYYGAEWLVKGSSSLARSLGVRPIVIGLTVVAFGTSAPELVVSLISSLQGKSMIAVGNVVGSNICNIALVLGAVVLFQPIACHPSVLRRDIPLMLGISLYLLILSMNSTIGRFEGATLFGGVILYSFFNYTIATEKSNPEAQGLAVTEDSGTGKIGYVIDTYRQVFFIVIGIAGVVGGAQLVISSAVRIMTLLGVSEKFIGLTIVAFGTSVPELATSVVAAIRREMDISLGNLVGSNVFNILSVIGAAALVRPIAIPGGFFQSGLVIDYIVMMVISFLPWLMIRRTLTITRKNGVVLLAVYFGYLGYLVWKG